MVGIGRDSDAAFYRFDQRLLVKVVITKHLTKNRKDLINKLIINSDSVILHVGCSGYGGTAFEPKVPQIHKVVEGVQELIRYGFPVEQMVLRVDPIFVNQKGLKKFGDVLTAFKSSGITRVRYVKFTPSKEVDQRFLDRFGKIPEEFSNANDRLEEFVDSFGYYTFESCFRGTGCLSKRDLEIFGMDPGEFLVNSGRCKCISGAVELSGSSRLCTGGCIYCGQTQIGG